MSVAAKPRLAFRLHTVFAVILLAVILLPFSGVYFFRIYETELVRQTESELSAQAVFISSFYKDAFARTGVKADTYGNPVTIVQPQIDEKYRPYPPQIDLREADIYPPRPDPLKPAAPADATAKKLGLRMSPVLLEAKLSTLASMRILDYQGVVVAGSAEEMGLSLAQTEEVAQALKGAYASVLRKRISDEHPALASISRGTDTRVFIALPIIFKDRVLGAVYLSRSPRNVLKSLYEERQSVFAALVFILLTAAGIAWVLSYSIGKPLSTLTRHAQQLTLGMKPQEKLSAPPIQELVSLTQSFEQMSSTIEARSEYIRSFAMHVAHEFKTPLTAIQGAVELLHDHTNDMAPAQRKRFMENIVQDTDRLKTLVSRLMELARADVMQAGGETADVAQLLSTLQKRYAGKIELALPEGALAAGIGPDILETALVNLIENSLQHGAKNIELKAATIDGLLNIDVIDNGQGISAGNAAKLFTPFFTTKREKGGTGLGLAITRSLLKAYGGNIQHIQEKSGAHFRLTLKGIS